MPTHLRRVVVSVSLTLAGVILLIGCIPFPGDHRNVRDGGVRPEEKIGKPGDERTPLNLKRSTRDDVLRVFGLARYCTRDKRSLVYLYNVRAGYFVNLPCFQGNRVYDSRYLVVRFGDQGVLESFKVYKRLQHLPEFDALDIPDSTRRALKPDSKSNAPN